MARDGAYDVVCSAFNAVSSLGVLQQSFKSTAPDLYDSYKMSHLLCSIRERTATKAIDKIYGALAMMPSSIQKSPKVDVSMTQAQAYVTFAKCLLERGHASLVLCHASHSLQVEGLPSWCPDFAEAPATRPLGAFHMIGQLYRRS
jgi:hypothetical protein